MTPSPAVPAPATVRPRFFGLVARWPTPVANRALVAASFGWMLDAFDVMLYSMVLTPHVDLGMQQRPARSAPSRSSPRPPVGSSSVSSPTVSAARAR